MCYKSNGLYLYHLDLLVFVIIKKVIIVPIFILRDRVYSVSNI